ncbi:glycosyltransferase family 2 protein [Geobacter sp. FeAm09]|uniref:glycosyltransferase family 2 protein n=1 Tax=Geobacter sp. FeAm09 TaxID=2597769 RepID=UPI0011EF71DD|nr:glycosyltransferase family 2 protein [Geobacter sp. FeAm09]QEM67231.1 glycosyltransferase family 2 protein [Geobacter sp. FeAm09]
MAERGVHTPLSVVIIAKNEAERLDACLQSAAWADEIVVVDSGSSDATREIARRYTDKVFDIPWRGFGPQKQAAVDLATNDWIFNIDCDERLTPGLAAEIRGILAADCAAGAYSVPRRTFLGSKEIRHCGWYPDRTIRLFDRRRARFSDSLVHERVVTEAETGTCREHLLHYSFAGVAPLLTKLNHYTELSARQMFERGRGCSVLDIVFRPLFALFKTYVLRLGFLDGVEGVVVSVSNAVSVFYKYVKLRELRLAGKEKKPL